MKNTIFQNTHNPFAKEGTRDRDLFREKVRKPELPLDTGIWDTMHRTIVFVAGLIAMMYGVLF